MPTFRYQPNAATVGRFARAGAAGRAQRENLDRALGRAQQYDLAQQGMALQREGMQQRAGMWAADRQMQQAENEAQRRFDAERLGETQRIAQENAQFEFGLNQQAADAAAVRAADVQKQAKLDGLKQLEESARLRREQFDYEQNNDDAKFDAARQAVIQDPRYTDEDRLDALLQIEAERANVANFKLPKKKTPTLRHQLFGDDPQGLQTGGVVEHDRGTFWQQPDGKVEFRPADANEPPITFKDYADAFSSLSSSMATETFGPDDKSTGVTPANPEKVQEQLRTMLDGYKSLTGIDPKAQAQQTNTKDFEAYYNSLKPGAEYVDPNGVTRRKGK